MCDFREIRVPTQRNRFTDSACEISIMRFGQTIGFENEEAICIEIGQQLTQIGVTQRCDVNIANDFAEISVDRFEPHGRLVARSN